MYYYLKAMFSLGMVTGIFVLFGYFFSGDDLWLTVAISTALYVVLEILSQLYKLNDAMSED